MSNLHIITDSAASIPSDAIKDLPMSVLPMWVQVNNDSYREGIDLDSAGLYEFFAQGALPTTSQPSPGDFLELFEPLAAQGKEIIAVLVTDKASGTCDSARIAAEMLPDASITVFDSAMTGMGTGLQALAAAKAARDGKNKDEIVTILQKLRDDITVNIAVPTVQYLRRSGRISNMQALLAGLLNIKVVLTTDDGLVVVGDKSRSWQGAIKKMEARVEQAGLKGPLVLAVHHTNTPDLAAEFCERLQSKATIVRSYVSELSASLAVHGGPGMLGAIFCAADLFPN